MSGKDIVYLAQVFRILSLLVLKLKIPLTVRLLILYAADMLDCQPAKFIDKTFDCHTLFYQANDKIIDTIVYMVVILYFMIMFRSNALVYVLVGFLLHRMVGVYKFIQTEGNPRILSQYPDVFREFSLYVAMVYDGYVPDNNYYHLGAGIFIIIGKILFEKMFHGRYKIMVDSIN